MSSPLVALVIVSWNGASDTIKCLKSIHKLTYNNIRTILVDNASTDDTVKLVERLFPEVEIIQNETNIGYGPAANIGINRALSIGANYVVPLNNDLILSKDFINKALETVESDNNIGAVVPKIYWMEDTQRINSVGAEIDFLFLVQLKKQLSNIIDKGQFNTQKDVDASGLFLLRREAIEKCGIFDEEFYLYLEDFDLCMRLNESGYRIVFNPEMILWHKGSASIGGPASPISLYFNTRNRFLLWKKHLRFLNLITVIIFFFVITIPIRIFYYIIGNDRKKKIRAFLKGIRDGLNIIQFSQ